ncbi:MAG TPA: LysR family transcriptional regulator [Pseudobdellovibrionaceae bacterium]|jgi:DNA-binding transcriptional LysR family regulator
MENIPVHLLNAFVVFNESKSIGEAAVRLQITQPALSKQLKQLEERLPNAVFTFSGRKKVLTSLVENFINASEKELATYRNWYGRLGRFIQIQARPRLKFQQGEGFWIECHPK